MKKDMAPKLENIRTQYHTFVDDQVLTAEQLNGFIHYFDDQDRVSRIFLTGVGIVCGFTLKEASANAITLTQGVGVTTDGDLLTLREPVSGGAQKNIRLRELTFSYYRAFEDKSARYPLFEREGEPMELWELLPEENENALPLEELPDLKGKTLLLYLETFSNEGDLCTAIDCDNQGTEQVERLRLLLISKRDAAYIAQHDTIFSKYGVDQKLEQLPDLAVRRVVLNPANSAVYEQLKGEYYKALNSDKLQEELVEGVTNLYSGFADLLQLEPSKPRFDAFPNTLKKLVGFTPAALPADFQYRYSALKELVACWNEIRESLFSLREECFPDIFAFPKHLLLGNLDEVDREPKQHRHSFYRSPALAAGKDALQQRRNLIQRFFAMAEGYRIVPGDVRITPSNHPFGSGPRAIPFYYTVDENLLKVWDGALSYHREKLPDRPRVQEPLRFDIDRFNLLRIEGHQGKNIEEALSDIIDLREKHGLAFDVKSLSIDVNSENLNIDEYECEFEDLNMLLRAWTAEQECVLAETSSLFSGFSTTEPGKNVVETKPDLRSMKTDSRILKRITAQSRKSNVISENLIVDENTLGHLMKTALDNTEGGSVNDIIATANRLVREKVDKNVWADEPETKEFVIDQSIEVMAYAHVLSRGMPGRIVDLTPSRVNSYQLTLKELCARVNRLKTEYQNKKLSSEMKAIMGVLINHLSGICCSAKKLEALLEEIDKRKEKILIGLQLSEFIKQHPGLEHIGGVRPGGTFILVYLTLNQLDTSIPTHRVSRTINRVVADFSLPYLCCSGCSPVNFIIQRPSEEIPDEEEKEEDEEDKDIPVPVNNCIKEATEAIRNDLTRLQKYNLPGSNHVIPTWEATSKIFGGTDKYKSGVLDDADKWLRGDHNTRLQKVMVGLLKKTAEMIPPLSRNPDSEEYQYLLHIFVLQLMLFHRVLGCQQKEALEKHSDMLSSLFEELYSLVKRLIELRVVFPEELRAFLKSWIDKVDGKYPLEEHGKRLLDLLHAVS